MLTFLLPLLLQSPPPPSSLSVRGPERFVPFSAELKITNPSRPVAYGRFVQDEHGCTRRETVNANGSLMVQINNFETGRTYRLVSGSWISQPMRLIPGLKRRARQMAVERKAPPVEGFDAYVTLTPVRSTGGPRGSAPAVERQMETIVIPALNFFDALRTLPNGDTIAAQNILLGPPDHSEFLPPPAAAVAERAEDGAYAQFSAVVVRVSFVDGPAIELTTTEERPVDLRTPSGEVLQIVTTVIDDPRNLVRVRVMRNAARKGISSVEGELLDEVQVALGAAARTTKLVENFSVAATRIRDRTR